MMTRDDRDDRHDRDRDRQTDTTVSEETEKKTQTEKKCFWNLSTGLRIEGCWSHAAKPTRCEFPPNWNYLKHQGPRKLTQRHAS